jgi:K+-transporting ATPase ATPase C chain
VRRQLRIAAILLGLMTLLTGVIYPLVVTGVAQMAFHHQANGSLVEKDGRLLGSELIGQPFDEPGYFWGRLSATTSFPYNAAASAGSNYGPLNPALLDAIEKRVEALRAADPGNAEPIPVDLVTYSASGLDPHISVASALYQIPRVARQRSLSEAEVRALVDRITEGRLFGILGEPRVNVLLLNLALDKTE